MSVGIRFQVLPAELEFRVKAALKALVDAKITDVQAASFFFKYFFGRLEPMYRDNPSAARIIQEAVKDQLVGLVVPKLVEVTLHLNTISDMNFTKGVDFKTPALNFENLQVVEDVILARITLAQTLMENKVKVKKMAKILKWLAPIATLQTEEMLQKVRDEDTSILDQLLKELGY